MQFSTLKLIILINHGYYNLEREGILFISFERNMKLPKKNKLLSSRFIVKAEYSKRIKFKIK